MYALVIVILQSTMRTRLRSPATLSAVVQLLCVFEYIKLTSVDKSYRLTF